MIIGSVLGEDVTQLETRRLDDVTQTVLDEIAVNPVIDEQLRANPVVMKELQGAVSRAVKGEPPKTIQSQLGGKRKSGGAKST